MAILDVDVVGVKTTGAKCTLGQHIPGATVRLKGVVGVCPIVGSEMKTGSAGIATFDFGFFCEGNFNLVVEVETPGGKTATATVSGRLEIFKTGKVEVRIPGACDEGSAGSDVESWWNRRSDLEKIGVVGLGALGVYALVRVAAGKR